MIRRIMYILVILAVAVPGVISLLFAAGGHRLYVVNTLSEDVSVIDTATDSVVGRIPLHYRGYRIAVSPHGDRAYITAVPGDSPQQKGNTQTPNLSVVDLPQATIAQRIPVSIAPLANVHIAPDGAQAYVVTATRQGARNSERGQVLFVDLKTQKVTASVPVGLNPLDSAMTRDGKTLYTADWASKSISRLDLASASLRDSIPLAPYAPRALALNPDGKTLFAALELPPTAVFNNATQQAMNASPNVTQQAMNTNVGALEIFAENAIREIDLKSGESHNIVIERLNPIYALAISPDGARLYAYGRVTPAVNHPTQRLQQQAAPPSTYSLLVIDTHKQKIDKRFGNFGYLSSMALNPEGTKLYLIGTAGDPRKETIVNNKSTAYQNAYNAPPNTIIRSKTPPMTQQQMVDNVMHDLSQVPKTVTVLNAGTGKVLKKITIGSLPQGNAVQ